MYLPLRIPAACLALALFSFTPVAAAKKPVTPEAAARARPARGIGRVVWSPDGERFVYRSGGTLFLYEVASGEKRELLEFAALESEAVDPKPPERAQWRNRRVRERAVQWFPDGNCLLLKVKGDLFIVDLSGGERRQLTATRAEEADPKLSPDGRLVSFRRGNELYVLTVSTGKVRRLTRDATATRWNARLDWVYPEELDLGTAHWWSPDSRHIAYLQFDVSREPLYPHADFLKLLPQPEPQRYPRAGSPNADVRLGVVSARGGRTRWLAEAPGDTTLFARIDWMPDSAAVAVQELNRVQDRLRLRVLPLKGKPWTLLEETDPYWINISDDLRFFSAPPRLLWSSERTGFRHLYLYGLDGKLLATLTSGDWEVTGVAGIDPEQGTVYFTATAESPLERHLYAVPIEGGEPRRLTREPGTHSIQMSPGARYYIDAWSSLTEPSRKTLYRATGERIAELQPPDTSVTKEYEILPVEIVEVKAPDGATLYARLIRPAGFEKGKKYPAVVLVYGGPHAQAVRNSWSGANLAQALAHAGFVVWQLDNRGSAGRGHEWEAKLYRRFGKVELEDQITGLNYLTEMGFVDPSRVGIHGWSYGGYMTLYAMLHAPDRFRAGVAGAPVTDWRNYDTIYTERYLGLPSENPDGYRDSSPVHFASQLEGHVLLIHNIEDDNVLFQNTLQMAKALQDAGKLFDMMVYPQKTHGVTGSAREHLYRTVVDYFRRRLAAD